MGNAHRHGRSLGAVTPAARRRPLRTAPALDGGVEIELPEGRLAPGRRLGSDGGLLNVRRSTCDDLNVLRATCDVLRATCDVPLRALSTDRCEHGYLLQLKWLPES